MFWKNLGKVLASIGKYSVLAATWASDHPEVIAIIQQIAANKGK